MTVYPYNPLHHEHIVAAWMIKRGLEPIRDLPRIGFIAVDSDYLAAAFLREIEGDYAFLDGLVSNPDMPGIDRNNALDLVVKATLEKAKERGFLGVMAYSKDDSTLKRSEKHGFSRLPFTMIGLKFQEFKK